MQIFISHSVAPRELAIVNSVADVAATKGATPIIAFRDWLTQAGPPSYITSQIASSDYVIAIITQEGHHVDWVNAEIAHARRLNKPLLIVADTTIGISAEYKVIRINRTNPLETLSNVSTEVERVVGDEKTRNLVGGILIGGLVLLLLASLKGE